jgi:hypothetical protein
MDNIQMDKISSVKIVALKQLQDIKLISGINSLILSVCLIDTLAGFYCGYNGQKFGNKERFLKFIDVYLTKHKSYLYDLRCNIVHSFSNTVSNFMFVDNKEFTNVFNDVKQLLDWKIFNIDTFKADLENAVEIYFDELSNAKNNVLLDNFNLRYDSLKILEDGVFPALRNSKGEYKFNIEDFDNIPGTDLKSAYYDPIKIKK